MYSGIHNFSEIGKLNKVLLHRPGEELESLTPATLERLLFDDIPYLKVAQEEHDRFAEVLRENGVEVIYYVDEVAKAIADPARQIQLVNDFLNISKIHAKGLRASMTSLLLDMPPKQMVTKMIAGIKRCEVATKQPTSLMDLVDDDYPFVSDPMPNLYFTRDPGACVGEGINIHRMHTPARKRESLLLKYMFLYNRDFATQDNKMWYDLSDSYSIEGGDVLVLSKDIVAIGLSERTTVSGAETFARNLLQNSDFKKVLAFDIPETRAFMHLDTVFTMVDYDKFTIHPEIEGPLSVYEMTLDEHGELRFGAIKEELKDILALELKLPAVDLIRCGGGDLMAAQREQWNDGSNTLCIAPGRVITYERNYVTNDLLAKHGLDVLTVPSAELSRGRGGPRCMSCPVNRDDRSKIPPQNERRKKREELIRAGSWPGGGKWERAMKSKRQEKILELIEKYNIETQEELIARLAECGIESKQTTVSRDIKELYLYKEPIGGGRSRYAVSGKADHIDNTKRLKLILNECSVGVDYAGIVVLLKTLPGLADAAGAAIDAMKLPDMLGCISGNDAVAIVARGEQEAERLCYDLRQYCK